MTTFLALTGAERRRKTGEETITPHHTIHVPNGDKINIMVLVFIIISKIYDIIITIIIIIIHYGAESAKMRKWP